MRAGLPRCGAPLDLFGRLPRSREAGGTTSEDIENSETSLIHPASRDRGRQTGARAEVFREARKPSVLFAAGGAESQALLEPFWYPWRGPDLLRKFRVVTLLSGF